MGLVGSPRLLSRHRLTVADFHRLGAAGVLAPQDRVVDLEAGLLRCHRGPAGDEYTQMQALASPGVLTLPGMPGHTLDLTGLMA